MRPAPPPHIRSSAAPRPAPRSRGARPAMAPVGERLAAAVARAIEGHDCRVELMSIWSGFTRLEEGKR